MSPNPNDLRILKNAAVPPEEWFGAALDAALVARDDADVSHNDRGWFHPSELSNPCDRYLQLKFIGVKEEGHAAPDMVFMGAVGTFIHGFVQEALRDHPRVSEIEAALEDDVTRVRGHNDMLIEDFDGQIAVLDIKSCNALPQTYRIGHALQGAWYCYLRGVSRFVLQYIRRENGARKRFTIPWAELRPLWEESRDRLAIILEATMRRELVDRTVSKSACRSCPFDAFCARTDKGANEWLSEMNETLTMISGASGA